MTDVLLYMLGSAFLLLGVVDVFLTILGQRGGGPLTNLWTRWVWRGLLAIHERRRIHGVLALAGPAMTVGAILVWYALLTAGWTSLFAARAGAVVVNATGLDTTLIERLYFVGATLSGTGYGDLVPSHFPWTLMANVSTFTATFVVTTSLSYLMPIIAAALERRQLARHIMTIGDTPREIVHNSWTQGNGRVMESYWMDLLGRLNTHAQKHRVYPMLYYFHASDPEYASTRAVLCIADATFLIQQAAREPSSDKDETGSDPRPPPGFFVLARNALEHYASLKHAGLVEGDLDGRHADGSAIGMPPPEPEDLIAIGLRPVDDEQFRDAFERYKPLRDQLVALCAEDGWS